jgi:hypothetical protein
MTYLTWGCDPLKEECESCLDALCNACAERFRKNPGKNEPPEGLEIIGDDFLEPDCDNCDLENKPDCPHCEIVLQVCRNCRDAETCEFRIC